VTTYRDSYGNVRNKNGARGGLEACSAPNNGKIVEQLPEIILTPATGASHFPFTNRRPVMARSESAGCAERP